MALKELSVKEALQLLAERYPEPVKGYFYTNKPILKRLATLTAVSVEDALPFKSSNSYSNLHFAIEVPDEYRYMTQQECID